MKVRMELPDLHQMDLVDVDTYALPVFEDQRPPVGLAGLVDWRLCGMLSNQLLAGNISGRFREVTMMPAYGRLRSVRVVVFGMGDSREFSPARAHEASIVMADSLKRLRSAAFMTSLPGSDAGTVNPKAGLEAFLEEFSRAFGTDEAFSSLDVHVVEAQEFHRELNDMVVSATRRLRGIWK